MILYVNLFMYRMLTFNYKAVISYHYLYFWSKRSFRHLEETHWNLDSSALYDSVYFPRSSLKFDMSYKL